LSTTPRVLVVDDDHVIATTLAMVLNGSGFSAVAAFTGPEALRHAHASHFDILITDVMMEPIDGVKLAIAFRNVMPASHIFLFTGTSEAAQTMLAASNAGYDFRLFSKPLEPAHIIETLRSLCLPAQSGTQSPPQIKSERYSSAR